MQDRPAAYGPVLALTVTLAVAGFLVAMAALLLIVHPGASGPLATALIGQNQTAKTALYLLTFAVILPVALFLAPRVADRVGAGPNARALNGLVAVLAATFAAMLVFVKLWGSLGLGSGLGVVLVGVCAWWALAAGALARAARGDAWPSLLRLDGIADGIAAIAGVLVLGVLLCVTSLGSASGLALVIGALAALAALAAYRRIRLPRVGGPSAVALEVVVILLLALAVPDAVVFHASTAVPNVYFPPGVIQFQQDWILGPANQLLAGGALLVNDPSSQYGVGLVYFVTAWFHLAPIGYGTFGLLDGILTALFYIAAYCVLRIAGVGRLLAASVLAFAVAVLVYDLPYSVGALPEEGPLRFGLPIAVILAAVAADRWPRRATLARAAALTALAVSSVWALEAFAYTVFTFAAIAIVEASLLAPGTRRRWLVVQAVRAAGACLGAHALLAGATLAATGRLPAWSQYLAFLRTLLLGGREGSITYGFSAWSPGLTVGAAQLASAAAVVLLVRRAPALARARRTAMIALTGSTAYAIASFSYIDNRSSTYLLLYTSLPVLMAGALWLHLLLAAPQSVSPRTRRGGLAFALCVAVLMFAAAWPAIGTHFSSSALAHAYPGGGLRAALHRLWHPPAIDPRAPAGVRLVDRFFRGRRALILLPTATDLAIEVLMRSGRASPLFIGDPSQDAYVPSVWIPKVSTQIAGLRAAEPVIVDRDTLSVIRELRGHAANYPLEHPVGGGNSEIEWILHQIDMRFRLLPIFDDRQGLLVARLAPRVGSHLVASTTL
jgi:hypothetical protein